MHFSLRVFRNPGMGLENINKEGDLDLGINGIYSTSLKNQLNKRMKWVGEYINDI